MAGNGTVTLVGSSWDHPRGHAPMAATAEAYQNATAAAVRIDWVPRSLRDFGMASVEDLARNYDLILIDHPHIGVMAESGCVVPIDELAGESALAARSPGRSHDSYLYAGHQWALAVDAACQTSAWRPDLLDSPPPRWEDVIALSRDGSVLWPLCDVDAAASLLTMAASAGRPCATASSFFVDREVGRWALEVMRAVAANSDHRCTQMNPIHVLDTMSRSDEFAYAPLTFCYVSYSRRGHGGKKLSFGDIPAVGAALPAGALLGGAGLAVSALRPQARAAVDYGLFVASAGIQRGLYFASGGQPAHLAAWTDRHLDQEAGGFFSGVGTTLDHAWTRPRAPWFAGFQNQMIELFAGWPERADDIEGFLDDLDRLYRVARAAAPGAG
jgi:multiple sugar transport system substrate-binding protein